MGGAGLGAGLGAGIAASNSAIQGAVAIKEANKAWQRQKTVLQNSIRWRVADLRAAGLNPILAAQSGLGAGGAPSVATAKLPDMGNAASSGARAGAQAALAKSQKENLAASSSAMGAKKELDQEATNTEKVRQASLAATAARESATANQTNTNTRLLELGMPQKQWEANFYGDPRNSDALKAKHLLGAGGGLAGLAPLGMAGVGRLTGKVTDKSPQQHGATAADTMKRFISQYWNELRNNFKTNTSPKGRTRRGNPGRGNRNQR